MKITSYNISRFRGNYKKGCNLPEVREHNMRRFLEFIDKEGLLQSAEDIILLQEVPYRQNQTPINKLFKDVFSKYEIIEPLIETRKSQSAVVALVKKNSNWKRVETENTKFTYEKISTVNKVLELEHKETKETILNLHITDDRVWDCLSDTLESHKYTYIVGDLNAHNNEHRPEDKRSPEKLKMFTDKGYKDLVTDNYVTFYSAKTTVDHMYYNTEQVKADEGDFSLIPINLSDHACLVYESKEK